MSKSKARAGIDVRNDGQRQLLERPESHGEVAARIGCTKQVVSYWRRGTKRPGASNRDALCDAYGIKPESWAHSPGHGGAPASAPAATAARGGLPDPLEHIEELLREARRRRLDSSLVPAEYNKAITAESRLLEQREKHVREANRARLEAELLEARTVAENPTWQRIRSLLSWLGERLPNDLADEFEQRLTDAVAD